MTVERTAHPDGSMNETIRLAEEEIAALDYCQNILQKDLRSEAVHIATSKKDFVGSGFWVCFNIKAWRK